LYASTGVNLIQVFVVTGRPFFEYLEISGDFASVSVVLDKLSTE